MPQPDSVTLNDRAFVLLDHGDLQGAKALFEQVCSMDSQNSEAMAMLGTILAEQGELDKAETCLRKALELDPDYADALYYLARVLQARGQMAAALASVKRAVELDPEFAEAQQLLLSLQQLFGSSAGNQTSSQQPTQIPSAASQTAFNQANSLLQQGKLAEAASYFKTVTEQQPQLAVAWFMLARTHGQQGQYGEAERCCLEAIRLNASLAEAHILQASILLAQGRLKEAYSHSDKALRLIPADINAIALAANIAKHMNKPERSYELLEPLLNKGIENINIALAFAMISKDLNRQQQAIDLMQKMLNSGTSLSITGRLNLHFNLGMLYDNIKQYDPAFSHYRQGNDLKSVSFNRQQHDQLIESLIATHSLEFMAAMPRSSLPSQRPIFIVGMVRSGTSLIEQILSSHPDVYGAGELGDIYQISNALPGILATSTPYPECLSQLSQQQLNGLAQQYLDHLRQLSPDAQYVVDKLPGNFMHLGLIELLFPDAHIIHCRRDPIDTCLSAYFQDFSTPHSYAYDLSNLSAFYRGYLKLMEHWRKILRIPLLEISYEDLVSDQEKSTRTILEFCGLEWDDRCLQFHKNKRLVKTAIYDQVNRPIYQQSVARWKNYKSHLEPLKRALKM